MRTIKQLLFIFSFLLSASFAFSQAVTWELHQGQGAGIFTPGPDDPPVNEILNELTGGRQAIHGDPGGFQYADIPDANDAGWGAAPLDEDGDLCWRLDRSRLTTSFTSLDFTYFQTTVNVTDASQPFILRFYQVDDGARAYVFNSRTLQDPENAFIEGGDARLLAPIAETDISPLFVEGEENRIVIVQFDDSQTANYLKVEVVGGEGIGGDEICGGGQIDRPIVAGEDDVEQGSDGTMLITSRDLEMVDDSLLNRLDQIIGLRFIDIAIPSNATIKDAYIQFTSDIDNGNSNTKSTSLNITLEAGDSAPFTEEDNDLTNRFYILENVAWNNIPAWTINEEAGEDQRTPDLSTLVQELVTSSTWNEGGAMTFLLEGTGSRSAKSFEGDAAPRLFVRYDIECEDVDECENDTEAPTIDLSNIILDTVSCLSPIELTAPEIVALDNCDENPSIDVQTEIVAVNDTTIIFTEEFGERPVITEIGTSVSYIYTATDASGNVSESAKVEAYFIVPDEEAPVIDGCPGDVVIVELDANGEAMPSLDGLGISVSDNCGSVEGGDLFVTFEPEIITANTQICIIRVVDANGNETECAFPVEPIGGDPCANDEEAPELFVQLSNGDLLTFAEFSQDYNCESEPEFEVIAIDDDGSSIDPSPTGGRGSFESETGIEIAFGAFQATDACGNTAVDSFEYRLIDTEAPELISCGVLDSVFVAVDEDSRPIPTFSGALEVLNFDALGDNIEAEDNCNPILYFYEFTTDPNDSTILVDGPGTVFVSDGANTNPDGCPVAIVGVMEPINEIGTPTASKAVVETRNVSIDMSEVQISPNPFHMQAQVQINLSQEEMVNIDMRDVSGQVVKSMALIGNAGENTFSIQRDGLATGVYFISVRTASTQQTLKVVVTQ